MTSFPDNLLTLKAVRPSPLDEGQGLPGSPNDSRLQLRLWPLLHARPVCAGRGAVGIGGCVQTEVSFALPRARKGGGWSCVEFAASRRVGSGRERGELNLAGRALLRLSGPPRSRVPFQPLSWKARCYLVISTSPLRVCFPRRRENAKDTTKAEAVRALNDGAMRLFLAMVFLNTNLQFENQEPARHQIQMLARC